MKHHIRICDFIDIPLNMEIYIPIIQRPIGQIKTSFRYHHSFVIDFVPNPTKTVFNLTVITKEKVCKSPHQLFVYVLIRREVIAHIEIVPNKFRIQSKTQKSKIGKLKHLS